jgi:two-component system, chemotaxis family, chemotaxis protein CheY
MAKTIMTVDDSISVRQIVAHTLKAEGYNVIEAVDGMDAQQKLKGASIDLLITDLNMPNCDGFTLIKEVRASANANLRFVPILFLTTESSDEKKALGRSAGATGWIVKPFKPEQLLTVVKKVIR